MALTHDLSRESTESSFREKLLEHVFVAELLQEAWFRRRQTLEVLRSEVDGSGYDLVLECGGVIRHVQLTSSRKGARTARKTVNSRLWDKPGPCVIWLVYEEEPASGRGALEYEFFGGGPGESLPPTNNYPVGRHSKGDATGYKAERPNTRVLPRPQFRKLGSISELTIELFGP